MIQPLVQELQHFLCFRFWPPGGQAKNQTLLLVHICTKFQANSSSIVSKRAVLTDDCDDGRHVIA
jgi:hypothetical protein